MQYFEYYIYTTFRSIRIRTVLSNIQYLYLIPLIKNWVLSVWHIEKTQLSKLNIRFANFDIKNFPYEFFVQVLLAGLSLIINLHFTTSAVVFKLLWFPFKTLHLLTNNKFVFSVQIFTTFHYKGISFFGIPHSLSNFSCFLIQKVIPRNMVIPIPILFASHSHWIKNVCTYIHTRYIISPNFTIGYVVDDQYQRQTATARNPHNSQQLSFY